MPCNMPAKGSIVKLRPLSDSDSLRGILEGYLLGRKGIYKLDMIFDTEDDSCRLILEVADEAVVAVCLDCLGETRVGAEALEALKRKMDSHIIRGYLELHEITRDAMNLDRDLEPKAFLDEPVRVEDLLREEHTESPETSGEGETAIAETAESRSGRGESKITFVRATAATQRKLSEVNVDPGFDIPVMLAESIIYSETVSSRGNVKQLLNIAIERSRSLEDRFCRVYFEAGDKVYNVLVYKGKVCAVVEIGGDKIRLRNPVECEGDLLECLGLREDNVRNARLYRVSLEASLSKLLNLCSITSHEESRGGEKREESSGNTENSGETEEGEASPPREPVNTERGEERRGFLSRLFRRRR